MHREIGLPIPALSPGPGKGGTLPEATPRSHRPRHFPILWVTAAVPTSAALPCCPRHVGRTASHSVSAVVEGEKDAGDPPVNVRFIHANPCERTTACSSAENLRGEGAYLTYRPERRVLWCGVLKHVFSVLELSWVKKIRQGYHPSNSCVAGQIPLERFYNRVGAETENSCNLFVGTKAFLTFFFAL